MVKLEDCINDFWRYLENNSIEIYNEFSLQHELGIYLRCNLPDYNVQFERNVKYFYNSCNTTKHEIDIVIFKPDFSGKYAIELKYPRNGQHPEQMYAFIKDIVFMEELKNLGFDETYTMTVVEDPKFYSGDYSNSNIYRFFRGNKTITGEIQKPTGTKTINDKVSVKGQYIVNWINSYNNLKYYFIKIK